MAPSGDWDSQAVLGAAPANMAVRGRGACIRGGAAGQVPPPASGRKGRWARWASLPALASVMVLRFDEEEPADGSVVVPHIGVRCGEGVLRDGGQAVEDVDNAKPELRLAHPLQDVRLAEIGTYHRVELLVVSDVRPGNLRGAAPSYVLDRRDVGVADDHFDRPAFPFERRVGAPARDRALAAAFVARGGSGVLVVVLSRYLLDKVAVPDGGGGAELEAARRLGRHGVVERHIKALVGLGRQVDQGHLHIDAGGIGGAELAGPRDAGSGRAPHVDVLGEG